jgi:mannose/fructose/N-acetylgalactosamine-specific phosphotransferase system component IID
MADTEPRRRIGSAVKWGAAALVLAAGYADLARGGTTIAPILLVIGYGILVPFAIVS